MRQEIIPINLTGVNCYLIKTETGCLLIDTGFSNKRKFLEKSLLNAGCPPENLKLIILTHGDMDHTANAAYLREKFGAKIAIHADDAGMVERGDMDCSRKAKSDKVSPVFRIMMIVSPLFSRSVKSEIFKPDLTINENTDLFSYGFEARVIHLPGHSKGSIGVLTAAGELFCGDFFYNMAGFGLINDLADHRSSLEKLKKLDIRMVYPGHGKPVSIEKFWKKCKE
jgi:hydroxyacylglutathione hydrolase